MHILNRLIVTTVLITGFLPLSLHAKQSVVVVANLPDKSINLSKQEVRNLFMGGALNYDLNAVALPPRNQTRVLFNTKVVGLTESRIQSYWAQMRFSGRKKPPQELENEASILNYLVENLGAVGYLPADAEIPMELTIIYRSK